MYVNTVKKIQKNFFHLELFYKLKLVILKKIKQIFFFIGFGIHLIICFFL